MSNSNKDNRTVHGKFKFGFKTKHRFPTDITDQKTLMDVTNLLYPTGRVWLLPEGGAYKTIHAVFNAAFNKVKKDSELMIDSYFPDNDNFTEEDAIFWENKLGLFTMNSLSLEKRKEIILRKIAFPQNIKARQGLPYINDQLELYGFNVKVYENIFQNMDGTYYYLNPLAIMQASISNTQHGFPTQHGKSTQHGTGNFEVIANTIEDESFSIGGDSNLYATFFIASNTDLYQSGSIAAARKKEFKELILKLKPAHMVAFCFLNYQ